MIVLKKRLFPDILEPKNRQEFSHGRAAAEALERAAHVRRREAGRVGLPVAVLAEDGGVVAAEDGRRRRVARVAEQRARVLGEERVRRVHLTVAAETQTRRIGSAIQHRRRRPAKIALPILRVLLLFQLRHLCKTATFSKTQKTLFFISSKLIKKRNGIWSAHSE
nr:hypothetical protein Itr_chr07CG00700 [Ipomoea trifida]